MRRRGLFWIFQTGGSVPSQLAGRRTAIVALAVLSSFLSGNRLCAQPPSGPEPVVVGPVIKSLRAGSSTFVGTVQPIRTSQVGSPVAGRVAKVLIEPGIPVQGPTASTDTDSDAIQGQVMVELETESIEIQCDIAEAQMKQAELALRELELRSPMDRKLLEVKVMEAQTLLEFSESELVRLESLKGSVSATELESARLRLEQNRQLVLSAKSTLEQFDTTIENRMAQAEASLAAARGEWRRWIDTLEKHSIRAPFDGQVTQKLTEVGRWLSVGDAVAEVVQMDPIELRILVPQANIEPIQQTMCNGHREVQVTCEGLSQPISGTIDRIVPQADLQVRSFPVLIRMENPDLDGFHRLKPGMIGTVKLKVGRPTEMMLVKKDALVLGGERPSVLVVQPTGNEMSVKRVEVETGDSFGDWIQIIGNINENDRVVVKGNERLRPGQPIRITETETDLPPES